MQDKKSKKSNKTDVFVYLNDNTTSARIGGCHIILAADKVLDEIENGADFNSVRERNKEGTLYVVNLANVFNLWSFVRKNHKDVFEEYKKSGKSSNKVDLEE